MSAVQALPLVLQERQWPPRMSRWMLGDWGGSGALGAAGGTIRYALPSPLVCLESGTTGPCETFLSPVLVKCKTGDDPNASVQFDVYNVEVSPCPTFCPHCNHSGAPSPRHTSARWVVLALCLVTPSKAMVGRAGLLFWNTPPV